MQKKFDNYYPILYNWLLNVCNINYFHTILAQIIKIGTRGSQLALWQANWVADHLNAGGFSTEIVTIETTGDRLLHKNIAKLGSKGVFTDEIEKQLREGSVDIAVHSAKDLQSQLPEDLEILAFTEREMVNDVLISYNRYFTFDNSQRIVLGTSSTRRLAQIRHYYPKVKTAEVRGNLQTRLKKLEEGICDALVLAHAGVHRMNYGKMIVKELPTDTFTPAVGQGALAIECLNKMPAELKKQVRKLLNHTQTETCLLAERAFLQKLQGGCSVPIFGLATFENGELQLNGGVVSLNGKRMIREIETGIASDPVGLGYHLAEKVVEAGGEEILSEIRKRLG